MEQRGNLPVVAVHHLAISVSNLVEAVDFYSNLGFREVRSWHDESGSMSIVHLELNGCFLEVFWYKDHRPAPLEKGDLEVDLRVLGVKHLALRVSNIREALLAFRRLGLADNSTKITLGRTGINYFFVRDPSGNWLEFVEDSRFGDL